MPVTVRTHVFAAALMLCVPAAHAGQDPLEPPIVQSLGAAMEGFPYPYPVAYLPLTMVGQMVKMAYMDVPPAGKPNGRNLRLLHGRNFGGYYWENTIRLLSNAGYRVVVPDQIGFGKSSKPDIGLSFHALARNTRLLLDHLSIDKTEVVAHSMGGMLAVRFALMSPEKVASMVLESPIGLEDYGSRCLTPPMRNRRARLRRWRAKASIASTAGISSSGDRGSRCMRTCNIAGASARRPSAFTALPRIPTRWPTNSRWYTSCH